MARLPLMAALLPLHPQARRADAVVVEPDGSTARHLRWQMTVVVAPDGSTARHLLWQMTELEQQYLTMLVKSIVKNIALKMSLVNIMMQSFLQKL